MKKVNLFVISILSVLVLCLAACKNNFQENKCDVAYISAALGNNEIRTAFPSFEKSALSDFELKAKAAGVEEEVTLGNWKNCENMENATISVTEGFYDFTLTAVCNGTKFSGSLVNEAVKNGYQTLNFILNVDSYGTFTEEDKGTLNYTITFDDDFYKVKEVWAYWDFYKNYKVTGTYGNKQKLSFTEVEDGTRHCTAVFEKNDFDCYGNDSNIAVCFKLFYENTDDGVVSANSYYTLYEDTAKLVPGIATEKNYAITIPEGIHNINYVLNLPDGADKTLLMGNLKKTFVESEEEVKLENIEYPYMQFKGFFDSADYSGNQICYYTGDELKSDHTLYAKWESVKFTITYNLNGSDSYNAVKGANAPDEFDYFSDFAISDASRDYYEFDGWTITKDDGTVIEEKITEYTIPGFTYNYNLTFTANWKNGPVGTKYSSTTTIPVYSIIYADGTYSSLDDFKSWSEEKQNLAKNRAIGVVYDSTNRMMVALENEGGSQNSAGTGNAHGDDQVQYAYDSATGYVPANQPNITGWNLPGADVTYSIVNDRDNFNNVIESIGGTSIKTNYWTSDIATPTSSTKSSYGRTANVYGVYYWGSSLRKSNEFWIYSTTNLGGLIFDSRNSYYNSISFFPSDLGWLAVKQY